MSVIISAGSNTVHQYENDGFVYGCCFESYGYLFQYLGHKVIYLGRDILSCGAVSSDIVFIEWHPIEAPQAIEAVRSSAKYVFIVQHGSEPEIQEMLYKCPLDLCDAIILYDDTYQKINKTIDTPVIAIPHPVLFNRIGSGEQNYTDDLVLLSHRLTPDDKTRALMLTFLAATRLEKNIFVISGDEYKDETTEAIKNLGLPDSVDYEVSGYLSDEDFNKVVASACCILSYVPYPSFGRDVPIAINHKKLLIGSPYVVQRYLFPDLVCKSYPEFVDKIDKFKKGKFVTESILEKADNYKHLFSIEHLSDVLRKKLTEVGIDV